MGIGYDSPWWDSRPDEMESMNIQPSDDDLIRLMRSLYLPYSPYKMWSSYQFWRAQENENIELFREILPTIRNHLNRESRKILEEFESIYEI